MTETASALYGQAAKKPHFYGIYDIKNYVLNKDTIAPLTTNIMRWRKLIIGSSGYATVKKMNDSTQNYIFREDIKAHTIVMFTDVDTSAKYTFKYAELGKDNLLLKGGLGLDTLNISLVKFYMKNFKLINRGFHWVNEFPYNR